MKSIFSDISQNLMTQDTGSNLRFYYLFTMVSKERMHIMYVIQLCYYFSACLVPVLSFGETDLYLQAPNPDNSILKRVQVLSTKYLGFSPPLFHGRGIFNYTFGLLPFRKPVHTVGELMGWRQISRWYIWTILKQSNALIIVIILDGPSTFPQQWGVALHYFTLWFWFSDFAPFNAVYFEKLHNTYKQIYH